MACRCWAAPCRSRRRRATVTAPRSLPTIPISTAWWDCGRSLAALRRRASRGRRSKRRTTRRRPARVPTRSAIQTPSRPSRPQRSTVETSGEGFFEITREPARFLDQVKAPTARYAFIRDTSASSAIQENADPMRTDLVTARSRLAPADAVVARHRRTRRHAGRCQIHAQRDPRQVPVSGGRMMLGTWQGIYVAEHRTRPHRRGEVVCSLWEAARRA